MKGTSLRVASAADADALAILAGELGYPTTGSAMRRRLETLLSSGNDVVFAATRRGSVIGWIHVSKVVSLESDMHAEICGLVVTRAQRGQGVGSQLVDAAKAWSVENSCPRLRVRSNVVRLDTRRFYEKHGFVVTKSQNVFDKPLS